MFVTSVKAALALGAGVAGFATVQPIYSASMTKVEVTKDINEGQQVESAIVAADADGLAGGMSLRRLKAGGYLARIPKGWDASSPTPLKALKSVNVCNRINDETAGQDGTGCPPCPRAPEGTAACMAGSMPVLRPV